MKNENLLKSYYYDLQSTLEHLSSNSQTDAKTESEKKKIVELLAEKQSWEKKNEIEWRMVFLMGMSDLDFEIEQKLISSKHYFDDEHSALYQEKLKDIKTSSDIEIKKKYLFQLIQGIQLQMAKRECMEPFIKDTKKIMMILMIISIIAILGTNGLVESQNWYFPLVMSAGIMGALFSMLTGISRHSKELVLDDVQNLYSYDIVTVRIALGAGAALLAYYFFQSNLFSFELFPDINLLGQFLEWNQCVSSINEGIVNKLCKNTTIVNDQLITKFCEPINEGVSFLDKNVTSKVSKEVCAKEFNTSASEISKWSVHRYKLITMSFLAGFSEKLVPSMLNKTKTKIDKGV